jgi:hypothetical protein
MAHACKPSYSGGRDQEDWGACQIVFKTLSRKKPFTKIGLVKWLKVKAMSSSPSTAKEKKKRTKCRLPERGVLK